MAAPRRKPRLEERLDALAALAGDDSPAALEQVREALAAHEALLVERAARLADHHYEQLKDDLAGALGRWLAAPPERDRSCVAKSALAEVLSDNGGHGPEGLWRRALALHQMDPVFSRERVDTAGPVRAAAIEAFARRGFPDVAERAVELLVDPRPEARRGAARALAIAGGREAAIALRLHALHGESNLDVLSDVFAQLAALEEERSVPFLARWLHADDAGVFEAAALAIGDTRSDEGARELAAAWERASGANERARLMLPLALARVDEAFAVLVRAIESEPASTAPALARALPICATDAERRARALDAARERGGPVGEAVEAVLQAGA